MAQKPPGAPNGPGGFGDDDDGETSITKTSVNDVEEGPPGPRKRGPASLAQTTRGGGRHRHVTNSVTLSKKRMHHHHQGGAALAQGPKGKDGEFEHLDISADDIDEEDDVTKTKVADIDDEDGADATLSNYKELTLFKPKMVRAFSWKYRGSQPLVGKLGVTKKGVGQWVRYHFKEGKSSVSGVAI